MDPTLGPSEHLAANVARARWPLLHVSPPRVSDVSFYLISRDPLVVVAPQEHPSCLVLQVRGLVEEVLLGAWGVLEGPRCRAKAYQPLSLSSTSSTGHLGIRDLGGKRPLVPPTYRVASAKSFLISG